MAKFFVTVFELAQPDINSQGPLDVEQMYSLESKHRSYTPKEDKFPNEIYSGWHEINK